ncbi:tetratricopeptide repeat protein [Flexibacterium corallicola]|uniref:tetratricopeptide repeat protein n=1 Tax=Flexibacterium corallicola TaxID=3037259 RepID=UPI00286F5A66|nr:tetratricopeptide repeat protein [Pseudovibrio sp. M1P-2-3]
MNQTRYCVARTKPLSRLFKADRLNIKTFFLASALSLVGLSTPLSIAQANQDQEDSLATSSSFAGSYLSGRSALLSQDLDSAARFFALALSKDPQNYYLQDRAFVSSLANGDISKAEALISDIWKNDPDHFLSRFAGSALKIKQLKYDEAITILEHGDINPLSQLTFAIIKAWSLAGNGETQAGIETLDDSEGPKWFELFSNYTAGLLLESSHDWQAASDRYKASYIADPGALRVANAYARSLAVTGQTDEAITVLDEYDKLIPQHPILLQTRKAIANGSKFEPLALTPSQGVAEALYSLGAAISRDGEELAAAYLQLASHLNPDLGATSIALGALFNQIGDNERAIQYLEQVPENSPLKREAEIQIGLHYNTLDDLDSAREHLQALMEQDPTDAEAAASLANVLRAHEKFKEAETAYTQAIDADASITNDDWSLLYFRGITRERQNKWIEAEADFRSALEFRPNQPMVLNYLGYSLVDRGEKLDEALEMIKTAVSLRPTDGYIVDSLGWVYYRLGRYDEAVKELERAIALRPQDPVINDHLGDAYWKVGRKLEARFKWNHARDLDPEPSDLARIMKKIETGQLEEETTSVGTAATSLQDG